MEPFVSGVKHFVSMVNSSMMCMKPRANNKVENKVASGRTITDLPNEIIYYIMEDENISIYDLLHLSKTCKKLNTIINGENNLWKKKCLLRWPWIKEIYELDCANANDLNVFWKKLTECIVSFDNLILDLILQRDDPKRPLSYLELKKFDDLIDINSGASPLAFQLTKIELLLKYNHYYAEKSKSKSGPSEDLSRRINQVLSHITRTHVTKAWRNFIERAPGQHVMEECGMLVLQAIRGKELTWYYKFPKYFDVLAEETKSRLREAWPAHPIFFTSEQKFQFWTKNNITENQWDALNSRRILNALSDTFFERVFENEPESRNSKEIYKTPLELAIIFEAVARRLGICCTKIKCSNNLFIKWKENHANARGSDTLCLNFFNRRFFHTDEDWAFYGSLIKRIQTVTRCTSSLMGEIRYISSLKDHDQIQLKFLLEHLKRIEEHRDMEDLLMFSKLYLDLTMVEWSAKAIVANLESNSRCCYSHLKTLIVSTQEARKNLFKEIWDSNV